MTAVREAFVGFDSAWAGNAPGGIASASFSQDRLVATRLPEPAGFDCAAAIIEKLASTHDYVLVAIDQPTVVPNQTGSRPVDRVAASLISRLRGGVQPANQGKTRSGRTIQSKVRMFGPNAPIWQFLQRLDPVQNPPQSRSAMNGLHAIEVFPALALPALEPAILERKRAARYNPDNRRKFSLPTGVSSPSPPVATPPLCTWTTSPSGPAIWLNYPGQPRPTRTASTPPSASSLPSNGVVRRAAG